MKVTAVIAEYNPFHNGHLYQLHTIRTAEHADWIVVVLSGDFMQRGIPAIVDKYRRCQMALANGADLVFELPVYFALGSAEYFAQGAVSLIDKLGVVDSLHFGSESGDLSLIQDCARLIASESIQYQSLLNVHLKQGCSFPAARSRAIAALFPEKDTENLLNAPNNILGIEYVKALLQRNSAIKPATLARKGEGYASDVLDTDQFVSANALRTALRHAASAAAVKPHVPDTVYSLLSPLDFLYSDDFSEILLYKLLRDASGKDAFAPYYDIGKQLSHTLYRQLPAFVSFEGFAMQCKTKNLTYTRICRSLMHILLDMTQEHADALKQRDYTQYARLLGFSSHGRDLLKSIKANASIPVVTKPVLALKQFDGTARMSLQADLHAANIYDSIYQQKRRRLTGQASAILRCNELTRQVITTNS
ncbi:MAG: nucleotidyltransferase [Lachnospiraceae bacterium]|nr:nucleotidyltransferase [Lachnospiraceae bacterium]